MIILAGYMHTKPELAEELLGALNSLVEPTLKEEGCLDYAFALQEGGNGSILVYERWTSQELLNKHLAQPSIGAVLGDWAEKIEIDVKKFDASNERGFMD